MSFRKRGEVINDGRQPQRNVAPRGIVQRELQPRELPQRGHAIPTALGRGHQVDSRSAIQRGTRNLENSLNNLHIANNNGVEGYNQQSMLNPSHPGVRPSRATSQQTTSTGCYDLDRLMGHMGFPLGYSLLIEEESTTDFNSILTKVFASQGIMHNRVEGTNAFKDGNTHLIVLSVNHQLAKELPGIYQGSRKEIKKSKIVEEQSKMTVSNMLESQVRQQKPSTRNQDLKIAWRYGFNDDNKGKQSRESDQNETYPNYNHQFDITSRLIPAPTSSEISFISPLLPIPALLSQVETTIKKHDSKLIRILLPNLLHPALYPPKMSQLNELTPLLHGLRSLLKKYGNRCVMLSTISTSLYHHQPFLLSQIRQLFDSVIILQPFEQEMLQFLERAYKSQPSKVQHGLVHVLKLPVFSERGEMHVMKSEWAFKNGRKKFEIEEWGIPVEDTEDTTSNKKSSHQTQAHGEDHQHQHTQNIDF